MQLSREIGERGGVQDGNNKQEREFKGGNTKKSTREKGEDRRVHVATDEHLYGVSRNHSRFGVTNSSILFSSTLKLSIFANIFFFGETPCHERGGLEASYRFFFSSSMFFTSM